MMQTKKKKIIIPPFFIGWNEWCELHELQLPAIKAKIDTGAKTSALHAHDIEPYRRKGNEYVRFKVHPIQRNNKLSVICHCQVIDKRYVTSSNGHKELRFVIQTPLTLGGQTWDIEITLSNRDPLAFRMLLGREALNKHVLIDPSKVLMQEKITPKQLKRLYRKKPN